MASEQEVVQVAKREVQRMKATQATGDQLLDAGSMLSAYECYTAALLLAPPLLQLRTILPELGDVRVSVLAKRAASCLASNWLVQAKLDASSAITEVCLTAARQY